MGYRVVMKFIISRFNITILIASGIGVLLNGCYGGVTNSKSTQSNVFSQLCTASFPDSSSYNIGGTYDSFTSTPTATKSCSKYGNNLDNITILNPSTKLDFSQRVDYSTIKSAIGMEYSAKIDLGFTEVHIHHQFAKTTQDDSLNLNLNYAYKYAGKAVFNDSIDNQGEQLLTPSADNALHTSVGTFRALCGDGMITQLDAGITLILRLNLHFKSHSEKNSFDETVTHLDGLQGVMAKLKQQQKGSNFTITASALQLGGDPQSLNQLFVRHGGSLNIDGYPELECSGIHGDSRDCFVLFDEIIDYATEVKQQLKSKADYYYSTPAVSRWSALGIDVSTSRVSDDALSAFNKLNDLAQTDEYHLEYSKEYINTLSEIPNLDPDFIKSVVAIRDLYQKINNLYNDKQYHLADNCAIGYIGDACVSSVSKFIVVRNEVMNQDKDVLALGSYLINNMYSADLITDPINGKEMVCDLIPISTESRRLFAINCNGVVVQDKLTLNKTDTHKLGIQNLSYQLPFTSKNIQAGTQIIESNDSLEQSIKFTYDLSKVNDELFPNDYYDFLYQNSAVIHCSNGSDFKKRLDVSKIVW